MQAPSNDARRDASAATAGNLIPAGVLRVCCELSEISIE
jgi:hypothetical protein